MNIQQYRADAQAFDKRGSDRSRTKRKHGGPIRHDTCSQCVGAVAPADWQSASYSRSPANATPAV